MQPNLVHSSPTMEDGRPTLAHALAEVSAKTGFLPSNPENTQVRFAYQADKTWRQRVFGIYQGRPASLRLDSHRLPVEEETMRDKFRQQSGLGKIFHVRPPHTLAWQPFDPVKGYGWSIDEPGGEEVLFASGQPAAQAAAAFLACWRELWMAVREPFWYPDIVLANELSAGQSSSWRETSHKLGHDAALRHGGLLMRLEQAVQGRQAGKKTRFQHAHLAGSDVRLKQDGNGQKEWVVFANHFWSWRQPGYDVAFAIWQQWMSLPLDGSGPQPVQHITQAWLEALSKNVGALVSVEDVISMLLNRCIGSLLLDLPEKRKREPVALVDAREQELCAEALRLLSL